MDDLPTSRPPFVFVSYSRKNREYVDSLVSFLRRHGIATFYDGDIPVGETYPTTIRQQLEECAALLVVMSDASAESDEVRKEIQWARLHEKPIFPLLLEGKGLFELSMLNRVSVRGDVMPSAGTIRQIRHVVEGADSRSEDLPHDTSLVGPPVREGFRTKRRRVSGRSALLASAALTLMLAIPLSWPESALLGPSPDSTNSTDQALATPAPGAQGIGSEIVRASTPPNTGWRPLEEGFRSESDTTPTVQPSATSSTIARTPTVETATSTTSTMARSTTTTNAPPPPSSDKLGPTIVELSAQPSSVAPGGSVTISGRYQDPSGVKSGGFYTTLNGAQRDICGQSMFLASGSITDGVWRSNCTVPSSAQSGTYLIIPLAEDLLSNYTNTNGGSTSGIRASFTVVGGSSDSSGPQVLALSVSPSTASRGQSIVISGEFVDESGVDVAGFYMQLNGGQNDICEQWLHLTSGNAYQGTWTATCNIPSDAPLGTYTLVPYASDFVLNWTNSNCCSTSPIRATLLVQP